MKRLLLIALTSLSIHAIAQTNTFPLDGNVGIGTTAPGAKLEVRANHDYNQDEEIRIGSYYSAKFYGIGLNYRIDATGGPSNHIVSYQGGQRYTAISIGESGKVGIGTTNPGSKLEIGVNHTFNQDEEIRIGSYYSAKFYGIGLNYRIDATGGPSNHIVSYQGGQRYTAISIGEGGNIGIGTANPAYKLDVLGTIRAKEVLVNLDGGADFVFEKDYKLPTIEHVASYVQANKHLPDIPSANEMVKNGVSMGDMQVKLLQKVEELTLYAIQQNKKIQDQEIDRKTLEKKYNALLEKVEILTKRIDKE